ncbi:TRAP transporter substrate-binding protein [Haloarcula amylovorans]|uniref:TRAP transporter substrate-binding protein n=1 Tax=Haloarcula amylovorans TaxID=2562280 RepID=UPI0010760856|nr:TRAP transporter substrate-binding protein [Halomicroarcula amylolytica]
MPQQSRRRFIEQLGVLGGAGTLTSLAGCSGDGGSGNGDGGSGSNATTGSSGDGGGGESQSMLIGSVFPSGHVINEMAKSWAKTVSEETGNRVSITIEPAFGGESEVMEQTRIGSIDGTIIGTRWVIDYDSKNFWVESPFVFESWEQQRRAFQTEYLQDGRKRLREEGNQHLVNQPIYRGYRHTSGKKAYETPEAIKGTNLRVPDLSPWVNIWEGIGASPTTVAFDELYSALQQGVVKAQENPAETVLSASLYEVQSHYTLTQHLASTGWFTFNNDTFTSLSEDDQSVLTNTLTQNIKDLSSSIKDSESKAVDELESNGMNIVEPDRDAWLSAAEKPLKAQFEANWEPSLEEVRNI